MIDQPPNDAATSPAWAIWFQKLRAWVNALVIPAGQHVIGTGIGIAANPLIRTINGSTLLGTDAGNVQINPDGTLKLNGTATVWEDQNASLIPLLPGTAGPSVISFNSQPLMSIYAFSGTGTTPDQINCSFGLRHSYKEGTDIVITLHWYPTNTTVADVKWQLRYVWFNRNDPAPAATTMSVVQTTSGTAWLEQSASFTISGVGKNLASRFIFVLFRDAQDAQDTYGFDAAVADIRLNYERDSLGTPTRT